MGLSVGKLLTYLFFPRRCPFCDEVISFEQAVCDSCRDNLPFIDGNTCKRCGCPPKHCKCGKMLEFDSATAPFYYSRPYNRGLLKFKTNREKWRAKEFAAYMADRVLSKFTGIPIDFAVCVPDHRTRINDKIRGPRLGYRVSPNITLASAVCEALDIPFKENVLSFTRETHTRQQSLSLHARKANVFATLDVTPQYADSVNGKTVLLIDDVLTTGATASECAKMLKLYGADKVLVITLFTTKQNKR